MGAKLATNLDNTNKIAKKKHFLLIGEVKIVGLGRIFCCQSVYLIDSRDDAEGLAPFADGKTSLCHLHPVFQAYGTAYLEVGETVNLGCS
jgi:hypothetical protein